MNRTSTFLCVLLMLSVYDSASGQAPEPPAGTLTWFGNPVPGVDATTGAGTLTVGFTYATNGGW